MSSIVTNNLPDEESIFVNRESIVEEIMETISYHRFWMIIISGMGGVGKSSLALHIAYRCLRERHFEAIVWNTAKSYELGVRGFRQTTERRQNRVVLTLNDLFNSIFRVFGDTSSLRLSLIDKQHRVIDILSEHRTLVIIDNLDIIPSQQAAEIIKFVRYSIPQNSTAIITSRYEMAKRGEFAFDITGLDLEHSIDLMMQSAQKVGFDEITNANRETLEAIHYATGGIPLAIKWALARMRRSNKSVHDILDELFQNESDVLEYCFKQAYWDVSVDARILLQAISPSDKPLNTFQVTNITGMREYQVQDAIDDLIPMSLLEKDSLGRIKLHPLTKAFARLELSKNGEFEREILNRYSLV